MAESILQGTTPTLTVEIDPADLSLADVTGISLNAGDVVTLRARSRASNYYMCVGNLIIEQTS